MALVLAVINQFAFTLTLTPALSRGEGELCHAFGKSGFNDSIQAAETSLI
jgi:hypothetical protein